MKQTTAKTYDPKTQVKEIKCKCNECGKVWHYLEAEEQRLNMAAAGNALSACGSLGMCCGCCPFSTIFSSKSLELSTQAAKLKKCPNCSSVNVTKTAVYHEKN